MSDNACESLQVVSGSLRFTVDTWGSGPPVVMLHGFPDTRATFRQQMTALSAAGYRVIAPSMRGYEPGSLAKDHDYTLATLANDVLAVIEQLGIDRVHLVGHDWGSPVAQACAAIAPARFVSLTLISVPQAARWSKAALHSVTQMRKSWYMLFFQFPLLPEWLIRRKNASFIEWLWGRWSPVGPWSASQIQTAKDAFSQPGVTEAALSYYRQNLNPFNARFRRTLGQIAEGTSVPTMGIIGSEDGCIDCGLFCESMRDQDFPAGLSLHIVEGAGHFPHLEAPDVVNHQLIKFFRACDDAGCDHVSLERKFG